MMNDSIRPTHPPMAIQSQLPWHVLQPWNQGAWMQGLQPFGLPPPRVAGHGPGPRVQDLALAQPLQWEPQQDLELGPQRLAANTNGSGLRHLQQHDTNLNFKFRIIGFEFFIAFKT